MKQIGGIEYNTKNDLLKSNYKLYECKITTDSYINLRSECRRLEEGQTYLISDNGCVCTNDYIPLIINYITIEHLKNNFKEIV